MKFIMCWGVCGFCVFVRIAITRVLWPDGKHKISKMFDIHQVELTNPNFALLHDMVGLSTSRVCRSSLVLYPQQYRNNTLLSFFIIF